jgi:16S rRNA (guanine966-N2)-methyltransferase
MPAAAETRITAGEWRGRALVTPKHGMSVRPTTALVRQALFNILGDRIVDAKVVDLYAGAGTVGFEALSRGAARVTFVERERLALECVAATAAKLGAGGRVRTIAAEVVTWLRGRPREVDGADLVFLDAPYKDDTVDEALRLLGESAAPLVVCEHHRARRLPERIGGLARVREQLYGATRLTILRRDSTTQQTTTGAQPD